MAGRWFHPAISQRKRRGVRLSDKPPICDNLRWQNAGPILREDEMLKMLLPVDGSASALNATRMLIETLAWYREAPAIELCTVHLPLPRVPNMGQFVSNEMVQKYYADESDAMLNPSRALLDAAGIDYTVQRLVGPIAETIVERAKQAGSDMIYMGTRGMSALANMAMGSVTTRVLHLTHIPVVLIH
jgi:nucleotide-binding universal stress UspA family protein